MFSKKKRNGQVHHQKEKQQGSSYSPPSEIPLANHPSRNSPYHSYQHNIMGSSLASVMNVRLCRDAFEGRFREGVCTYIGGGCESKFLSLFCGGSLVYKVWIVSMIIMHLDCHL